MNPFAVAIARFRLTVAALKACSIQRLADAPEFQINVATGDSLLHGPSPRGLVGVQIALSDDSLRHFYDTEDADLLRRFLGQRYHVVVGNPPYITVKDSALNDAYRIRFESCYRQYSLAVPFKERFFALTIAPATPDDRSVGFIGMITASSFMKREFGKKLVEKVLSKWDLTHVVDTTRAHIPGHGTPTVILFARNRPPIASEVRCAMGIKAESKTPVEPARGIVWRSLTENLDNPTYSDDFVTIAEVSRAVLGKHPWTLGGGGAVQLFEKVSHAGVHTLNDYLMDIGASALTRDDEVYVTGADSALRLGIPRDYIRPYIAGEDVRDWIVRSDSATIWPYSSEGATLRQLDQGLLPHLWKFRTQLKERVAFGLRQIDRGLSWFEYSMLFRDRFTAHRLIAFSNVQTHNHFVLSPGHMVFNAHAPVMVFKGSCSDDDCFAWLAIGNSSIGCFWMKQVSHNKGGGGIGGGLATESWEQFYEFDSTKLKRFPVPNNASVHLAKLLHASALEFASRLPGGTAEDRAPTRTSLSDAMSHCRDLLARMVSLQEELDWYCYRLYGLLTEDLCFGGTVPPLQLGQRAFEIALARRMAEDDSFATAWFDRHGGQPTTESPSYWPKDYQRVVERRLHFIEADADIALVEQPEYKRRWNVPNLEELSKRVVRRWLLSQLECSALWGGGELLTVNRLADKVGIDHEFLKVAEVYRGRSDFDVTALVQELVESESVPSLAALRYCDSGLRKRAIWKRTWKLQRREDAIDAEIRSDVEISDSLKADAAKKRKAEEIGDIPLPPRYESKDFRKQSYWSLRGKLDVPKERFISFPFCERDVDPTPVIGWAGWDHLQQAQAIAAYYERVKNHDGWTPERRVPLLTGILEVLAWLKQWHNDIHPEYHERMGDFFQQFVDDEARAMELTLEDIRAWTPPVQSRKRAPRKQNK